MKYILVINAGSSSLKVQLFDYDSEICIINAGYEGLNSKEQTTRKVVFDNNKDKVNRNFNTHELAVNDFLDYVSENKIINSLDEIKYVGHRVVHGGEKYNKTIEISKEVLSDLEKISFLAPLHNPINIQCVKIMLEKLPKAKEFAVFDTAFHSTMPQEIYLYGLPKEYYDKYKIRKYGFHGISHKYVANRCAEILNKNLEDLKIITCHLGNGQSVTAVNNGKSYDTSMGFTPLEGLVMGTRAGSFDPEIILFLLDQGLSRDEIKNTLNKKSGLLGLSNLSHDHRIIESSSKEGNADAILASNMMVNRIVKTIGSYVAEMRGVDAIVFTGGIGENSPYLRKLVLEHFRYMDLTLDDDSNEANNTVLTSDTSKIIALVIPTNEELQIVKEIKEII